LIFCFLGSLESLLLPLMFFFFRFRASKILMIQKNLFFDIHCQNQFLLFLFYWFQFVFNFSCILVKLHSSF
jgi:hypothetical protein